MGLFDLFTNADAQDAANSKIQGLSQGYSQASDLYGQGRNALSNYYGTAVTNASNAYQPFAAPAVAGYGAYADATGANGSAGQNRARDLFLNDPGISSGLNMGLDAIDRRAAARGMLGSGNTNLDTIKFAGDYLNQKYGDYVNRLSPFTSAPSQATSNAGVVGGLLANEGNSVNSSYGNQGNLAFNTQVGIGNAQAAADLANQSASQNVFNAVGQGIGLGTKLLGFL